MYICICIFLLYTYTHTLREVEPNCLQCIGAYRSCTHMRGYKDIYIYIYIHIICICTCIYIYIYYTHIYIHTLREVEPKCLQFTGPCTHMAHIRGYKDSQLNLYTHIKTNSKHNILPNCLQYTGPCTHIRRYKDSICTYAGIKTAYAHTRV